VNALVFREFIQMKYSFRAFGGLPIGHERRYFLRDGKVICHHPYWPLDAIKFWQGTPKPINWKFQLHYLNREYKGEIKILTVYAQNIATVLSGYWSVDFCRSTKDGWYFIDCASGEDSWHPECEMITE